jgi:hypothetical protein
VSIPNVLQDTTSSEENPSQNSEEISAEYAAKNQSQ